MASKYPGLVKLPAIDIPYSKASERYGGQVAMIMDKLLSSRADPSTKAYQAHQMKWSISCERAPDPENTTDVRFFVDYLATNSKFYLRVIANKWTSFEEIFTAPPQFMAQFEQRARHITNSRLEMRDEEAVIPIQDNAEENQMLNTFDAWCRDNGPDQKLATIARMSLEYLIDSVSKPD